MASFDGHLQSESIFMCIQLLEAECDSKADLNLAIDLVLKICRNIQKNSNVEKYKKVKKDNKSFSSKVWQYSGGQQLMLAIGWTEVEEYIMFLEEKDLASVIKCLEEKLKEYGLNSENATNSHNNVSNGWTEEEIKEKEKILQKHKENRLAESKRKKDEEQRLKAQIAADRDNTKAREVKASKAVERNSGHNVRKFGDIGVDLNNQGG